MTLQLQHILQQGRLSAEFSFASKKKSHLQHSAHTFQDLFYSKRAISLVLFESLLLFSFSLSDNSTDNGSDEPTVELS
jgi:hypothetical protein